MGTEVQVRILESLAFPQAAATAATTREASAAGPCEQLATWLPSPTGRDGMQAGSQGLRRRGCGGRLGFHRLGPLVH